MHVHRPLGLLLSRSWWYLCYFLLLRIATTIAVTATPARKHKISLSGIIGANLAQIHWPASLNQFSRFTALIEIVPDTTRITPTSTIAATMSNRLTFFDMSLPPTSFNVLIIISHYVK